MFLNVKIINVSVKRKEQTQRVFSPIVFVKNFPTSAPEKKLVIIIRYLALIKRLFLSFFNIYCEKNEDALLRFPVHIVVEYGLPFKLLNAFVCNEHTNEIRTITILLCMFCGMNFKTPRTTISIKRII